MSATRAETNTAKARTENSTLTPRAARLLQTPSRQSDTRPRPRDHGTNPRSPWRQCDRPASPYPTVGGGLAANSAWHPEVDRACARARPEVRRHGSSRYRGALGAQGSDLARIGLTAAPPKFASYRPTRPFRNKIPTDPCSLLPSRPLRAPGQIAPRCLSEHNQCMGAPLDTHASAHESGLRQKDKDCDARGTTSRMPNLRHDPLALGSTLSKFPDICCFRGLLKCGGLRTTLSGRPSSCGSSYTYPHNDALHNWHSPWQS